jgi:hypothetical protein
MTIQFGNPMKTNTEINWSSYLIKKNTGINDAQQDN